MDDDASYAALPLSTWDESSKHYADGFAIVHRSSRGRLDASGATTSGRVERVLFIDGHLLAVSDLGLTVARIDSSGGAHVVWPPVIEREEIDGSQLVDQQDL